MATFMTRGFQLCFGHGAILSCATDSERIQKKYLSIELQAPLGGSIVATFMTRGFQLCFGHGAILSCATDSERIQKKIKLSIELQAPGRSKFKFFLDL